MEFAIFTKAWEVVGYSYAASTWCPGCIEEHFGLNKNAESGLDQIAGKLGIDRYDEETFDSGDFPKVIFASSVEEGDCCMECGEEL